MDDVAINKVVEPILRKYLADWGFEKSSVRSGEDHDGDAVLFVEVDFLPGQEPVGAEAALRAIATIRDALAAEGESRFPHLRYRYPDDEEFADSAADAAE